MSDYDAIIIGAGHNGLVAANVLAKSGAKVLVLERAHFLGGMAATRELFDGYKHSVGAWAVLIWRQEMTERLELTKWGFELMNQWTSTCTFGAPEDTPFVMYNDLERMGRHLLEDHGPDVAAALDLVNSVAAGLPAPRLALHDGRLELGAGRGTSAVATGLAQVAEQAVGLLGEAEATRLRACYAPGCVLYFMKTHPRREWCSVACGNRVRAARHYQRARGHSAPESQEDDA